MECIFLQKIKEKETLVLGGRMDKKKVSIFMLTHNAPLYVLKSILSVKRRTVGVDYELIIVDNNSKKLTKILLEKLDRHAVRRRWIDKIVYNPQNSLFAGGNNLASTMASPTSSYYLLLNSDIKIKDKTWLADLLKIHPKEGGISSYGAVLAEPRRADGYCMLIDSWLYQKYKLDEAYEWWWSITKIQGEVLSENRKIVSVIYHENKLHHYGGKSGKDYRDARGMDIDIKDVKEWFDKGSVEFIDHLEPLTCTSYISHKWRSLKRLLKNISS